MKILLVGAGKMGGAMIRGWADEEICVVESGESSKLLKNEFPFIKNAICYEELSNGIDVTGHTVVLAVKPQVFPQMGFSGQAEAVISIMAGVRLWNIQEHISSKQYVRAMPNVAAQFGKSTTALTGDEALKEQSLKLFSKIGKAVWLKDEKELDIATALCGSSPAFLALIADAMSDAAVKEGLKKDDALALLEGVFDGMGALLANYHPAMIKDAVTSPGGTTAAGLAAMEVCGVRSGCMQAITAAYEKAVELSKK